MSEQKPKSTPESGSPQNDHMMKPYLPNFILALLFIIFSCFSVYFLNRAISHDASKSVIALWAVITCLSFLVVFITVLFLLLTITNRQKKEERQKEHTAFHDKLSKALSLEQDDEVETVFYSPVQIEKSDGKAPDARLLESYLGGTTRKPKPEISFKVDKTIRKTSPRSAIRLMALNLESIKDYYDWSRDQAKIVFGVAVGACICGILIIIASFVLPIVLGLSFDTALLTAIGGMITTVFSGSTLLVYKSSVTQLNHYHESLHEDQRFLSTVDLLDRFSSSKKRDDTILEIIQNQLAINLACAKDNDEEKEEAPTSTASTTTTSTDASPASETPSEDTADAEEK